MWFYIPQYTICDDNTYFEHHQKCPFLTEMQSFWYFYKMKNKAFQS
jgi:hypothetical protein